MAFLRCRLWSKQVRSGRSFAERFCDFLIMLGPVFIKFGQALSTRMDALGPEVARALMVLQDNLEPFPYSKVQEIIERDLGLPIEEIFSKFSTEPKSAASVAQVHRARLRKNDKEVAVKVLRPKIKKKIGKNLNSLKRLLGILKILFPKKYQKYRLQETFELLAKNLYKECDLRFEAAHISQIRDNLLADLEVRVPKVYWEFSQQHVLTMEWIEGRKVLDIIGTDEVKKLSRNLALSFFNQAYRDGIFHGDMHAGNVLVDENGKICLIDFGSIGFLGERTRFYLAEILRGFLYRDYQKVADIQFQANFISKKQRKMEFVLACRAIGERCINNRESEISIGEVIRQFFTVLNLFEMEIQPHLLLFQKNVMMVEGLCRQLDPEMNLWSVARPWVEQWARENFSVRKQLLRKKQDFQHNLRNLSELYQKIDRALDKILER